jgi:hypothetical protein
LFKTTSAGDVEEKGDDADVVEVEIMIGMGLKCY